MKTPVRSRTLKTPRRTPSSQKYSRTLSTAQSAAALGNPGTKTCHTPRQIPRSSKKLLSTPSYTKQITGSTKKVGTARKPPVRTGSSTRRRSLGVGKENQQTQEDAKFQDVANTLKQSTDQASTTKH